MNTNFLLWRASLGLISLALVACSANEPEVRQPETTRPANEVETTAAPQSNEEPATPQGDIAPPPPPPPEAAVGGPTPPRPPEAMVQQILGQKVLDHPQVRPYLHTEVPANLPLTVHAVSGLELGAPRLTVAGQPVRVTPTANEARFRFTATERMRPGARRRIRFEIPNEGVVGHVDLELRDYVWHTIDARVVEQ